MFEITSISETHLVLSIRVTFEFRVEYKIFPECKGLIPMEAEFGIAAASPVSRQFSAFPNSFPSPSSIPSHPRSKNHVAQLTLEEGRVGCSSSFVSLVEAANFKRIRRKGGGDESFWRRRRRRRRRKKKRFR